MSIRTCVMTVKGDGKGRYGKFKEDTTRTIEGFIVDNQHLYTKVLDHVLNCGDQDPCDPLEVIHTHIRRTESPLRKGVVSESLFQNILRYKRRFGDRVPDELVTEAAKRMHSISYLHSRDPHIRSGEDVLDVFKFVYDRAREEDLRSLFEPGQHPFGRWEPLMRPLVRLGQEGYPGPLPPREELMKLVAVVEVLTS